MSITISIVAAEQSTFIITCAFADEDGNSITPTSAVWSLTDAYGNIINDLEREVIDPLAASIDIVLTGDDLQIVGQFEQDSDLVSRKFLLEAIYDSDAGSDLTLNEEASFSLENLNIWKIGLEAG
jgi:hypothetical protein